LHEDADRGHSDKDDQQGLRGIVHLRR
jgi:hypothetical protein